MKRINKIWWSAALLCLPINLAHAQATGDTALEVSPAFAWINEASPFGTVRLSNPGTRSIEVLLTVGYGVIEASPDGSGNIIKMDSTQVEGNLTPHLTIFPPRMVIPPGETQFMRYAVNRVETLKDGGYAAMLLCNISPRAPINPQQVPQAGASIQINFTMSVPLIMNKGGGTPLVTVDVLEQDSLRTKLLISNESITPWGGMVRLMSPDGTVEYGSGGVSALLTDREVTIHVDPPISGAVRVVFDSGVSWIPRAIQSQLSPPTPVLINQ